MPSKEVERAVFELSVRKLKGFPTGRPMDHESPDFLVSEGGRTVGIEMQEFIQGASPTGSPARAAESNRAKIMRMARTEFESLHPDSHLYVYAHWRREAPSAHLSARDLAQRIASAVEHLQPVAASSTNELASRDANYSELEAAGLADRVAYLKVLLNPRATYGLWASPEWGFSSQDLGELQNQIRAKESLLPTYRLYCDEVWLVVYALALPSGGFDMEVIDGQRMDSSFDHVVFIDVVSGLYVSLAGAPMR